MDNQKMYTPDEILALPMPPKPDHQGGPGWLQWVQMRKLKEMARQFKKKMASNPGLMLYISFPVDPIMTPEPGQPHDKDNP